MATDFTIILSQRRHFGDDQNLFGDAPFIGPNDSVFDGEFSFNCQNIDLRKDAILMFQSRHVTHEKNIFRINGLEVFGGLPVSPARESAAASGWNSNVLIVNPTRHSLEGMSSNRLLIESRDSKGLKTGNRDDFVVDNIVLFFKTRQ